MPDPLDVLRLPRDRVAPRADFDYDLLAQVRDALDVPIDGSPVPAPTYATLDDALEMLADTSPEFDPFRTGFCLTNHAPMVAEALCAMGRADAVIDWIERYRPHLDETPAPVIAIARDDWRDALGDFDRIGDWITFSPVNSRRRAGTTSSRRGSPPSHPVF